MALEHIKIQCIDAELCQNCPELDIEIDHYNYYVGPSKTTGSGNTIQCSHYKKCLRLLDYIERAKAKNEEMIQD